MDTTGFEVRLGVAGDEPVLRSLRIQALSEAPAAFGSTLDRELARTSADWQRWLSPSATFLLDTPSGPKGMAAGVPDTTDPAIVHLMAIWVDPALRGSGAADALVNAVVAWAGQRGARVVHLDVIAGNGPAHALYRRHRFEPTGHTAIRERDGAIEVQMARQVNHDSDSSPASPMDRRITGFHQDHELQWVADLECGHSQHVRHDPPWQNRPWVLERQSRETHLGTVLPCRLCLPPDPGEPLSAYADARLRGVCEEGAIEAMRRRRLTEP